MFFLDADNGSDDDGLDETVDKDDDVETENKYVKLGSYFLKFPIFFSFTKWYEV